MASPYLGRLPSPNYDLAIYQNISAADAKSAIGKKNRGIISGEMISSEIAVRGSNQYNTLGGFMGEAVGNVNSLARVLQGVRKGADFAKSLSGAAGIGVQTMPQELTRMVWSGSETPTFTVTLLFVCLEAGNKEYEVVPKVNSIMRYLYPSSKKKTNIINTKNFKLNATLLTAPAGYNPNTGAGIVRLRIGNWFNAGGLVIESANFDYSKEVNRDGQPLYAIGQVMFKPYIAITYDDFKGYFTASSGNKEGRGTAS